MEILTVNHSYDQILQAKQTSKMLAQIAGEADLQETVTYPQEISEIPDLLERAEREKEYADYVIQAQAEEVIRKMMGQRASRLDWGNATDLTAKDKLPGPSTPSKVNKRTRDLMGFTQSPNPKRRRPNTPPPGEPIDCDR